ncbi:hypothetical protein BDV40DRAFT_305663 [Aspergillus tamarii]|uniref:Uncharacterized protein n=1 Tax=Aspergillus tamarii TaxID=41984 RepID=A0A5N6UEA0_ASPTM|nr:hypothetical protein BDV40DRAFT_305663 [Aspergillus tamarii]
MKAMGIHFKAREACYSSLPDGRSDFAITFCGSAIGLPGELHADRAVFAGIDEAIRGGVEDGAVKVVEDTGIGVKEARIDESSDREVITEEGMIIFETPLSGAFIEKVSAVVIVGATAVDVMLMPETEISLFHPITAIALAVELLSKVVVTIVQSPGFSDAVDPNVRTILDATADRQSPSSLLFGIPFSRIYSLTPNQRLNPCSLKRVHVRRAAHGQRAGAIPNRGYHSV